jgi:hypothetical protein
MVEQSIQFSQIGLEMGKASVAVSQVMHMIG